MITLKNILNIAKKCSAVSGRNILSPKRTPSNYYNTFFCFKKTGFIFYIFFYIIKLFAHIYIIYIMSAIAGQTAGPNGLNFFEETHWYPRDKIG